MSTETDKSQELGEKIVDLLESSAVTNLKLEEEGSISGDIGSNHYKELTFEIDGDFINVTGKP